MSTTIAATAAADPTTRKGLILGIVAAAQFMIVLDVAIVNVALPSIQVDLGVAQNVLQWVAVAYGLCFGGFLLLGGRAADLFGRRRMLLAGLALFALASLTAGLAGSIGVLILSRAAQGLGAAMTAPAALSILASTFREGQERNRALAIFGAVGGTAASFGVAMGGILTSGPGWEWIFFVNVPIGALLILGAAALLPESRVANSPGFDPLGALLGTGGLLLLVYGLFKGVDWGWTDGGTVGLLAGSAALLIGFLVAESRLPNPMLPLRIFRNRSLASANAVAALLFGAFFPTIFISTLYMQQVLGFSSLRAGFFYLTISASFLVVAALTGEKLIARTGPKLPLIAGQVLAASGLLYLTQASPDGTFLVDLLPGFLLLGVGLGLAVVATQVSAFTGVAESDAGLASGLFNTSQEIGGALGVAIASTVALSQTQSLLDDGVALPVALTDGFQGGYLAAALLAAAAGVVALLTLARRRVAPLPLPATPAKEPAVTG